MAVIIKLTGPNYKEFHRRKGSSITKRPLKCIERHRSYNRIGFGVRTLANNDIEIVALTCRTKQELSGGAKTGTNAWEKHLSTTGRARWFDYKKGFITSWRIY